MNVYEFALNTKYRTRKNVNFGCTEAKIPFTNTKGSLEELDYDHAACMTAICYSDSISTISLEILLLP